MSPPEDPTTLLHPAPEASPTEAAPSSRAQERSFFVRMKSTLTKRGLHVKASGYKVGVLAGYKVGVLAAPGGGYGERRGSSRAPAGPVPRPAPGGDSGSHPPPPPGTRRSST